MSIRLKDGGPAFPCERADWLGTTAIRHGGMSMRQYYAAHAPAEIPDWFAFTMSQPRPVQPNRNTLTTEQQNQLEGLGDWLEETQVDLEVLAFARQIRKVGDEQKVWDLAKESGRYFAWRWHFAEMMLGGGQLEEVLAALATERREAGEHAERMVAELRRLREKIKLDDAVTVADIDGLLREFGED